MQLLGQSKVSKCQGHGNTHRADPSGTGLGTGRGVADAQVLQLVLLDGPRLVALAPVPGKQGA